MNVPGLGFATLHYLPPVPTRGHRDLPRGVTEAYDTGGGASYKLYGLPRFPTHVGRKKNNNFGKIGLTRTGERRARVAARR